MKGIMKLFPAALALVALASCSNDDLFEKSASQAVNGKTMEASIEDFNVATRAAFAENKIDGKANKRALVWTVGDSYKVYGEYTTPDKYTLQNASAGKANGTFDLMTEDYNEHPVFAVFPYDKIDADRANSKLTVTLSDWTYATAEVKEDADYSEGGFVSNVPMYGKIGSDPTSAAFGYMTAILRVDLAKLPKRTTRLILVTDRPLTGTFETEFDVNGAYPEIASPVSNDTEKDNATLIDGTPVNNYIMAIATEPVSQRTNKTFFIAVPTGNKYNVFDIYVEYNMAGSTKTELVGKLGNTSRLGAGKSVLNWERGKVKSLTKEITVTASGNTPKALSAFLASEWKSFPADQDINITVAKADGTFAGIDLSEAAPGDNIFTIPAELKDRVVNIIVDESVTEGYENATGKTMTIEDEDKAPVASKALRLINFCLPTAVDEAIVIDAPESQIAFTAPDGKTATYKSITATTTYGDMANDAAGLTVGEGVTVTGFVLINENGGSFLNAGTINNIRNKGNYTTKFTGNANKIFSDKAGEVVVVEANTGDIEIHEGALTVTGLADKSNTIGTISAFSTGAINVKNVDVVTITPAAAFAGAVTVDNVNTFKTTTAIEEGHDAEINISKVANSTFFGYKGTGKVTLDEVKGAGAGDMIVVNQPTNAQPFTATKLSGSFDQVKYNGTGDVDVEGVDAGVTLLNDSELKGGAVTLKNIIGTAGKKIDKTGTGALTIEACALQTVENAGGAINATGVATGRKSINALTQKGAGKITLNTMQDVTTLTLNVNADVDYVDSYIATLTGNAGVESNIYGTKSSGVGQVTTITVTPTTDVWDGTSKSTTLTNNIYTSASLAKLTDGTPGATITQYLDLDMGNQAFAGIKEASADATYDALKGTDGKFKISNLNGTLFQNWTAKTLTIKNLELNTVAAANAAIMSTTAVAVNADALTVDGVTLSATHDAGGLIGIAKAEIDFKGVTVKNVTIASASTGLGTDINLGGFIGQVDAAAATIFIKGGNVETAAIKGHYYMGGFIGQVVDATNVKIMDVNGAKDDTKGSEVKGIAFAPVSADGTWSTLKSGTIAPFIGGIKHITTELNIYGKFDSFDRNANKWNMNFLSNEDFKFYGTKEDNCNFIGFIDISTTPTFTYYLKHVNGFEANPYMKIATTGDNGKTADNILATDCNVYFKQ